jgi:hypothetical protein
MGFERHTDHLRCSTAGAASTPGGITDRGGARGPTSEHDRARYTGAD